MKTNMCFGVIWADFSTYNQWYIFSVILNEILNVFLNVILDVLFNVIPEWWSRKFGCRVRQHSRLVDKCNFNLDKCNLYLDKCNLYLDKCNLYLDKCNLYFDKCNLYLDKCNLNLDKCNLYLDKCNLYLRFEMILWNISLTYWPTRTTWCRPLKNVTAWKLSKGWIGNVWNWLNNYLNFNFNLLKCKLRVLLFFILDSRIYEYDPHVFWGDPNQKKAKILFNGKCPKCSDIFGNISPKKCVFTYFYVRNVFTYFPKKFFKTLKRHRNFSHFATSRAQLAKIVSEILAFEVDPKYQHIFRTWELMELLVLSND